MEESQRRGLHDVRDLSRVAYGFLASKALFGALHLDLFTHLSGGARSSAELSRALGMPEHRVLTLLSALAGLGLVECSGGLWRNSTRHRSRPVRPRQPGAGRRQDRGLAGRRRGADVLPAQCGGGE